MSNIKIADMDLSVNENSFAYKKANELGLKGTGFGYFINEDGKIIAASCVLPLSHRSNIPQRLGLRHRAALGISEHTNVLAFVVSEETGRISYARGGEIVENIPVDKMHQLLGKVLFVD